MCQALRNACDCALKTARRITSYRLRLGRTGRHPVPRHPCRPAQKPKRQQTPHPKRVPCLGGTFLWRGWRLLSPARSRKLSLSTSTANFGSIVAGPRAPQKAPPVRARIAWGPGPQTCARTRFPGEVLDYPDRPYRSRPGASLWTWSGARKSVSSTLVWLGRDREETLIE